MIKDMELKECKSVLSKNYIGRIGYISQGSPDILPMTFYYHPDQNSIISYSSEGGKIMAMRNNSSVSFQVDDIVSGNEWRSVLVRGEFEEISGTDAKYLLHEFSEAVKAVIKTRENASPKFISEFSSKLESQGTPIVFRIRISEITGKQRVS
ncbi:flavin mononucleotide-binding protein [Flavobacteriaceae bacterium TP-CH-4]|uniref:Flavin mononucleotide-binding protein n=1 Tax=Pelagihabitans pacificus TaxID=2696054 RepID=A0A967AUI8_9FLAO|nr:pyridoxamine 5'-phosphate oxidase family protein [Pelagihabitans pacificus]NHF59615.1 flavin mononucleotide-binding protein [Pelagihabitans pacificus]